MLFINRIFNISKQWFNHFFRNFLDVYYQWSPYSGLFNSKIKSISVWNKWEERNFSGPKISASLRSWVFKILIKGDKISYVQIWWKHIVPDVRKDVRIHKWMQSSKPAQAGIMVAANYTNNTVCWPIIVPFRQTRRVITCQVLNINTVLVKYLRITMQIQMTHRGGGGGYSHMWAIMLLPWVPEAFFMRGFRFRHPRKPRGLSQSRWWKRRDESIWKRSSRLFSWPDWLPLVLRGWGFLINRFLYTGVYCMRKVWNVGLLEIYLWV